MRRLLNRLLDMSLDYIDRREARGEPIVSNREPSRPPIDTGLPPVALQDVQDMLDEQTDEKTDEIERPIRSRNSTDDEIRTFIAAWAAGEHPKAIQARLGYADIDKVLRAVEGEHYVRNKGYVDPPVQFRPEFDDLRRQAVVARLAVGGPYDSVFDRVAWRLQIPVPQGWNARRSKPGVRLHPTPEGFKRHPDPRYYRLAVHSAGRFLLWNAKRKTWTPLEPRPDRDRHDLVVSVNNHTVNAPAAVIKTWEGLDPKGIEYKDGDRKNLALKNLVVSSA